MTILKIIYFLGIFILIYSYFGYGLFIWTIIKLRKKRKTNYIKNGSISDNELPVSIVIAAYNEEQFIKDKIENTLKIDYPTNKFQILIITDGSNDETYNIAKKYERIEVLHENLRKGKIAAIHRAMKYVLHPIVVFSDANTLLNKESIKNISRHYTSDYVGGVAGEKIILQTKNNSVAGSGEGLYWKYESKLKQLDSDYYTVVGAAGELFSIRKELYEYVGQNIILDDFIISLNICKKGFKVVYEPNAFAIESPSQSIAEEQKRKIRISAGAFQSIVIQKDLLNVIKYPKLSFQYISHRLLRWTLCPIFLPIIFFANIFIVMNNVPIIYIILLIMQILFYQFALLGYIFSKYKLKIFYIPYYFVFLNLSLYMGFYRYLKGKQSVLWDKATREAV